MRSLEAAIATREPVSSKPPTFPKDAGPKSLLQIGAPYVDPQLWIESIRSIDLPTEGATFEPTTFTPSFQKHAGQRCQGLQIRIQDRDSFQPYRCGIAMLIAAAKAFPRTLPGGAIPTNSKRITPAIDLLYGSPALRNTIEGSTSIDNLSQQMERFETWYQTARKEFLLY